MTRINTLAINVLAAAATLACIGTASAQETTYNPNAYILLNGSAVKPDSKYPEDKTGFGGGLKVGIPLNPSWDLQIGGNYAVSTDHSDNLHQTLAGVDALYLFTPAGFRPFVLAGVGVSREKFADPAVGSFRRTSPYANLGVGFQYKFTPTLGMQADIREVGSFYRSRVDAYDMKHAANTYANVGLTWAFGGPPAPPVVPVTTTTRTEETTVATTPAPAPVVAPPPPPPAPVMKKYTLSASELFGFNSAKLGPNQPKLDEVAATMNANADIASVTIVGYTDRIGSTAYNQKLSEQRANSVKAYLQDKGVAASRLTAVGKGEADPVVECKDEKKRPALIKCLEPNRRVEIEPVTFTKQVN
jgi:OOP family OmpA-OmpF porin